MHRIALVPRVPHPFQTGRWASHAVCCLPPAATQGRVPEQSTHLQSKTGQHEEGSPQGCFQWGEEAGEAVGRQEGEAQRGCQEV